MSDKIVVAALYKFVTLQDYAALREPLLATMLAHGVKGTLLLAEEGINGTVSASRAGIDALLAWLRSDPRLAHHQRTEIGAADADAHDVGDGLMRVAQPVARAHRVGEARHAVEHSGDLGHDVLAADPYGRIGRAAQGHVQHGPVLGGVDRLAAEHGGDALGCLGLAGELQEQGEGLVGDAVLRVVEDEAVALQPIAFGALRVGVEQFAHRPVARAGEVLPQRAPGRELRQDGHGLRARCGFSCRCAAGGFSGCAWSFRAGRQARGHGAAPRPRPARR